MFDPPTEILKSGNEATLEKDERIIKNSVFESFIF